MTSQPPRRRRAALGPPLPGTTPHELQSAVPGRIKALLLSSPSQSRWAEPGRFRWAEPGRSRWAEPGRFRWAEPDRSRWAEPGRSRWAEPGRSRWAEPGRFKWAEPVQSQNQTLPLVSGTLPWRSSDWLHSCGGPHTAGASQRPPIFLAKPLNSPPLPPPRLLPAVQVDPWWGYCWAVTHSGLLTVLQPPTTFLGRCVADG